MPEVSLQNLNVFGESHTTRLMATHPAAASEPASPLMVKRRKQETVFQAFGSS